MAVPYSEKKTNALIVLSGANWKEE